MLAAHEQVGYFLRDTARRTNQDSGAVIFGPGAGSRRAIPLDEQVRISYLRALIMEAESANNKDKANGHFTEAATMARERFKGIPINGITAVNRRCRADYGELAVLSLLGAGEIDSAREFAERFSADPLIPEDSRVRVAEMIAPQLEAAA